MGTRIVEFFGYKPLDPIGASYAASTRCPFVQSECIKPRHGACSLEQSTGEPIIICPNRLYAQNHKVLADIAQQAFGEDAVLKSSDDISEAILRGRATGNEVAVFGKYWGSELSIPQPPAADVQAGGFFIDYILARLSKDGKLSSFTAVEIQTIDTTNSYSSASKAFFEGREYVDENGLNPGWTNAGLNWANVSKRILPQLIYKGHVLRREALCDRGMYFVCPTAVLQKIYARLGTNLLEYPQATGTLTFQAYDLGKDNGPETQRQLIKGKSFTTTVDQVAYAFVSPVNLPPMSVYENAIDKALVKRVRKFIRQQQNSGNP